MTWLGKMYQEEKEAEVADAVATTRKKVTADVTAQRDAEWIKTMDFGVENLAECMKLPVEKIYEMMRLSQPDCRPIQTGA